MFGKLFHGYSNLSTFNIWLLNWHGILLSKYSIKFLHLFYIVLKLSHLSILYMISLCKIAFDEECERCGWKHNGHWGGHFPNMKNVFDFCFRVAYL